MEWDDPIVYVLASFLGAYVVYRFVYLVWRLDGMRRIRRAGPRRIWATTHRIWREPSSDDLSDLRFGPGAEAGRPVPPFRFVEEHSSGSWPCVAVRDGADRLWRVKWGDEAKPETFCARFAWALGYFAEVTHYVAKGRIEGIASLTRARECVTEDGAFENGRFELEDRSVHMLFNEHSWSWDDNPFLGTPQLSGLKIVNMLLSNWDTKDRRDVSRGSNTAIFEHRVSRWRFEAQTPGFVTGITDGFVGFAYQGQRTPEIARGITVADAAWFYGYAERLTEGALRDGLTASGATGDEAARFARALRDRIEQIGHAAKSLGSDPLHGATQGYAATGSTLSRSMKGV